MICNRNYSFFLDLFTSMMFAVALQASLVSWLMKLTWADPKPTVFETHTLPDDRRLMASVGNGYLATTVFSDTVYVSGVFNGRGNETPSHRFVYLPCLYSHSLILRMTLSQDWFC